MTALDTLVVCIALVGLIVVGVLAVIRIEDAAARRRRDQATPQQDARVVDIRAKRKGGRA